MQVFSITRRERNGTDTILFKRFVEDMPKEVIHLAQITAEDGGTRPYIVIRINGADYKSLVANGQSVTFKLEDAP